MKVNVNFKQVNSEYNKEYADEYHFGKESENNQKYKWEVGYSTDKIKELIMKEGSDFLLEGTLQNDEVIKATIPNMNILECITEEGGKSVYAVSNSLLRNTHKTNNPKYNNSRYYFYMKDNVEFAQLGNGLYVDVEDLPNELIKKND